MIQSTLAKLAVTMLLASSTAHAEAHHYPVTASTCGKHIPTQELMACNIYHETSVSTDRTALKNSVGISFVVLNRAEESGKSIRQVINEPHQFSWTSGTRKIVLYNDIDRKAWKLSKEISKRMLQMQSAPEGVRSWADITKGSTFYHEKSVHPVWRHGLIKTAQIGSHVFYRLPDDQPKQNKPVASMTQ
jgi:spore germination cell wall hydrolase CwlJ-like protein